MIVRMSQIFKWKEMDSCKSNFKGVEQLLRTGNIRFRNFYFCSFFPGVH